MPKNVPVPRPSNKAVTGKFRHFLGYSYLIHKTMMKCCQHYWLMGITWNQFYTGYKVHSKGKAVACLLFQTFQLLARANSISDVYILVQYTSDLPPDERELMHNLFLDCTDGQSVVIVNLWEPLAAVKKQAPKRFERYYDRHMTYEGNYFVAQQLLKAMNNR